MTQTLDPVALAIAQAQAVAQASAAGAAAQPQPGTAMAPAQNSMPAMPAAGPKLTMGTLQTGAMNVDAWLKVKEFGLLIGDKPNLIEDITVTLDMTEGRGFVPKYAIKAGNPAQYWTTLDNVLCASGGTWDAAIQKASALDSKARPFPCVDLPFTVEEDVKVMVKAKGKPDEELVLCEAGTKLGYTTSTTNWKAWEQFYREVSAAGLLNTTVLVKLSYESKTNKAGNVWGIVTFELLGEVGE